MKSITVYCGSSTQAPAIYTEAAAAVGREIAAAGARLITGAGRTGLMGAAVGANIAAGGESLGIIPRFMVERGWHHRSMTALEVVADMGERKKLMAQYSAGVIALPGGIGTFDELTEIITWRQLGIYVGNVVIYNVDGYYDAFLSMIHRAIDAGFMQNDHLRLFTVASTAAEAVAFALNENVETGFSAKF